ncbi:hypothetical protein [Sulfurimonas sp. HSL-1716]|uniref:hypothetical protein n=1 Tax=Hydrocurvibacter sulfurireducens TaxID=3131937 RepID=UPI0031F9962B
MPHKLHFEFYGDKYFINVAKKTLLIVNIKNLSRQFYYLDGLHIGDAWIILEATLSSIDAIIWEFEDIDINFKYSKKVK